MNVKDIVTKSRLKKVVALAVVCAVAYGGGSYYMHSQREAAHARAAAANETIVANEAAQRNVAIVDKATVQSNVAAAIGQDEGAISWKSINLQDGLHADKDHRGDKDGHQKEHRDEHKDAGQHPDAHQPGDHNRAPMNADMPQPPMQQDGAQMPQMPQPPQMQNQNLPTPPAAPNNGDNAQAPAAAPTDAQATADGQQGKGQPPKMQAPFHPVYTVKCEVNGVHYRALVDAVSGDVIHCEAR